MKFWGKALVAGSGSAAEPALREKGGRWNDGIDVDYVRVDVGC